MSRVARRPAAGYALTLAAAGLFAVNGTVSTLALEAGIAPTRLTALRCTGAAVGLFAVLAVAAPGRLRVRPRELPFLALFGVVGVAMTQFLYYVAIGRMPVGIALVFEMTAPVFIALYVWLVRREHVRSRLWLALLLSLSGLVLVAEVWQDGGSLDPLGVGAGLLAAVCLAAYYLLGERGTGTRDPVTLTCWSFVAAAVFWSLAAPWWDFDPAVLGEPVPVSVGALELPLWVLVVWIVVLGAIVPFWLSIASLRHLHPDHGRAGRHGGAGLRLGRGLALGGAGAQRVAGGRGRRRPDRDRTGADRPLGSRAHPPAGDAGRARVLSVPLLPPAARRASPPARPTSSGADAERGAAGAARAGCA